MDRRSAVTNGWRGPTPGRMPREALPSAVWTSGSEVFDLWAVPLDWPRIDLEEGEGPGSPRRRPVETSCDGWLSRLTPDEQARAKRLQVQAKRWQFAQTRLALREILSRATGREPLEIDIRGGKHGKPYVVGGPAFSVSHSGPLAVIAVEGPADRTLNADPDPDSKEPQIGIDVERVRLQRPLDRMAKRFFSEHEAEQYLVHTDLERPNDFYRRWALKEAYVKALGTGLTYSSRAFCLRDDEPRWELRPLLTECRRNQHQLERYLFANGWYTSANDLYSIALCTDRDRELRFFELALAPLL